MAQAPRPLRAAAPAPLGSLPCPWGSPAAPPHTRALSADPALPSGAAEQAAAPALPGPQDQSQCRCAAAHRGAATDFRGGGGRPRGPAGPGGGRGPGGRGAAGEGAASAAPGLLAAPALATASPGGPCTAWCPGTQSSPASTRTPASGGAGSLPPRHRSQELGERPAPLPELPLCSHKATSINQVCSWCGLLAASPQSPVLHGPHPAGTEAPTAGACRPPRTGSQGVYSQPLAALRPRGSSGCATLRAPLAWGAHCTCPQAWASWHSGQWVKVLGKVAIGPAGMPSWQGHKCRSHRVHMGLAKPGQAVPATSPSRGSAWTACLVFHGGDRVIQEVSWGPAGPGVRGAHLCPRSK